MIPEVRTRHLSRSWKIHISGQAKIRKLLIYLLLYSKTVRYGDTELPNRDFDFSRLKLEQFSLHFPGYSQ